MQEDDKINVEYLNETLDNHKQKMELALQVVSIEKTVRGNTIHDSKDFNSQLLATEAEKREQVVSMRPAIRKLLI